MFTRKVLINLVIVALCGVIAISIPVIIGHQAASASDNSTDQITTSQGRLVPEFVGERYQHQIDTYVIWQIYLVDNDTVTATWDEIYAALESGAELLYDHTHLILTPYGLVYSGIATAADYQSLRATGYMSYVSYQGHTCKLELL